MPASFFAQDCKGERTMIRRIPPVAAALAIALAGLLSPTGSAPAEEKKEGTVQLFNGKNLDGWKVFLDPRVKNAKPEEVFSVKEGVIHCKGKPNGYLLTTKEHSNYLLTVEWRWPGKGGNSGVFVHVSGPDKVWPKGVEAQLQSGHAGDFWLVGDFKLAVDKARQDPKIGRHYFRLHKDDMVEKPIGQWNRYEITCKGNTVKLVVNGKEVNQGAHAEADKGKILLQSEGTPIEFRHITLTPIK
jgi:3-keto-disaccharide hydrolase